MRITLFGLILVGCTVAVAVSSPELQELENVSTEQPVYVTPLADVTSTVDLDVSFPEQPVDLGCQCEWVSWSEHGLLCVGVVCNEFCSRDVAECRELRRTCIWDE